MDGGNTDASLGYDHGVRAFLGMRLGTLAPHETIDVPVRRVIGVKLQPVDPARRERDDGVRAPRARDGEVHIEKMVVSAQRTEIVKVASGELGGGREIEGCVVRSGRKSNGGNP